MLTALATVLGILGGSAEIGGFALEHPHFWKHTIPEGEMKALCANAFKSYNADTGLWQDNHGRYHYCPPKK
jgi:hypothetical protein